MTAQTFVVPYLRTSPVHVPRRDLVLGMADSLNLAVSIIETDDPSAPPLDLTGGVGAPALQMLVWPDQCYRNSWDYGVPAQGRRSVLWSALGIISTAQPGTFIVSAPSAFMSAWPRRCSYALQLTWDAGDPGVDTSLLAHGILHLMRSVAPPALAMPLPPPPTVAPSLLDLVTDDLRPILASDTLRPLETS